MLIQFPGSATWFERIAVSVVTDFEWFLVQPDGRMTLVNLGALDGVKLVPAGGGRPVGVRGTIEVFLPAPSPDQKRDWQEEGSGSESSSTELRRHSEEWTLRPQPCRMRV